MGVTIGWDGGTREKVAVGWTRVKQRNRRTTPSGRETPEATARSAAASGVKTPAPLYACRSASTTCCLAACRAGSNPPKMPITTAKIIPLRSSAGVT